MGNINWKMVIGGAAIFVLGIASTWVGPQTSLRPELTIAQPSLYDEAAVTSIYDRSGSAVFEIQTAQTTTRGRVYSQGLGSGFLIKDDGSILTNNHVIDGASRIYVVLSNGRAVTANVIGTDPIHDLALIKVDPSSISGITPLVLADSAVVKPGQMAIAVGSPFGLQQSITVGVISGLNRSVAGSRLTGMLQTDAALNPGNSGGPLLNAAGEVIGINTAIEAQPGATGIGYAVPSNVAKNVLPTLSAGKPVQQAWIGISYLGINAELAQQLELPVNQGIYLASVISGSPAERAGLKGSGASTNGTPLPFGDIITAVDGYTIKGIPDFLSYVSGKQVGDEVTFGVLRAGNSINIVVTLGIRPPTY